MKTGLKLLLSLLLLLALPAAVQAQFTFTTNNGAITITGYTGSGGSVTIPSSTNGYPVTSIGDYAFFSRISLTSVTIPSSVVTIGDYAFLGCTSLTGITIPDSVSGIGEAAFCATGLTSVTIPNSVTSIGAGAFAGCHILTGVYFQGYAPSADSTVFSASPATVHYLPGTSGWSSTFGGVPTALWFLPNPLILNFDSFGVKTNHFGFIISWATNIPVVVEACTNLVNHSWSPVHTNTLTGGWSYFSDPQWTNYGSRFYRCRSTTNTLTLRGLAGRVPPMAVSVGMNTAWNTLTNMAASLNTSGLAAMGFNMIIIDARWAAPGRAPGGGLDWCAKTLPHGSNDVPLLNTILATNGCTYGLYIMPPWGDVPADSSDPFSSSTQIYKDAYQISLWGAKWLKIDFVYFLVGGGGNPDSSATDEAAVRYYIEQAAAGLDDGALVIATNGPVRPVFLNVVMNNFPLYPWLSGVVNGIYLVTPSADPGDFYWGGTGIQTLWFNFLNYSPLVSSPGCTMNPEGVQQAEGQPWWTTNYARAEMGIYCMGPFSLFLCDTSKATGNLNIYTNLVGIHINQDPLVMPGHFLWTNATQAVLYRPLQNGDVALGLWNLNTNAATTFTVNLSTVPGLTTNRVQVLDAFDRAITNATGTLSATVNTGGFNLYRLITTGASLSR